MNLSPNKLILLTFIIILIGVNSHSSYALGACETNVSQGLNCVMTSNIYEKWNGTLYKINALNTSIPAILVTGNNITIDFNGGGIVGNKTGYGIWTTTTGRKNLSFINGQILNYSYGITTRGDTNVTIWNITFNDNDYSYRNQGTITSQLNISKCIFQNATVNIYAENVDDSVIYNNDIYQNSGDGIQLRTASRNSIYDNNIYRVQRTGTSFGIKAENNGYGNHSIFRNNVTGFDYDIRIMEGNSGVNVTDNNAYASGTWGIATSGNNTLIQNNNVYNCSWNCIYYEGYSNVINNNYVENFFHHGIDHHSDTDEANTFYNNITNNIITATISDYGGDSCIYAVQTQNCYFYNNTCKNLVNETSTNYDSGRGITSEGNVTFGNRFVNNTFSNISGWCAREGANNNTWSGNIFSNCSLGEFRIRPLSSYYATQFIHPILRDNIYVSGIARISYPQYEDTLMVDINETSTLSHTITFINDGVVSLNFSGRKNFNNSNTTLTLFNIGSNYSIDFGNTTYINNINTLTFPVIANQNVKVGLASSAGGCDYPTYGISPITNTTLCSGTYLLSPTDTSGAVRLTTAGVYITCLGTRIQGNSSVSSSRGISITKSNTGVNNCSVGGYHFGIRLIGTLSNSTIKNNYINDTYIGIYTQNVYNSTFYNNKILQNNSIGGSGSQGISLDSDGFGNNISNNNISNYFYQILLQSTNHDNIIDGNYLYNGEGGNTGRSIEARLNSNNTKIRNNYLFECDRNCIVVDYYNFLVEHNFLNGYKHHGIDVRCGTQPSGTPIFGTISNNDITNNNKGIANTAIVVCNVSNTNINNNNIHDIPNSYSASTLISGIAIDPQDNGSTYRNISVFNNNLTNITGYCLQAKNLGTYVYDNILSQCTGDFYVSSYNTLFLDSYFTNNIFSSGIGRYIQSESGTNFTILENSTQHIINLSNGGKIFFNSPITKDLTINGNNVSIRGLQNNVQGYSYYSIFYSNQSPPIATESSGDTFNISMDALSRLFVFSYLTNTEPRYTEIATTITIPPSSITTTSNSIEFNCTGTGVITINNILTNLGGTIYYVYHNGALVETAQTDSYSTDGTCSSWLFTSSDLTVYNSEVKPSLVSAYITFAQLFAIFLVVVLIGAIIFAIKQFREGNLSFSFDNMFTWLMAGGVIVIFVTILMLILFTIIATTGNILR